MHVAGKTSTGWKKIPCKWYPQIVKAIKSTESVFVRPLSSTTRCFHLRSGVRRRRLNVRMIAEASNPDPASGEDDFREVVNSLKDARAV